MPIWDIANPSIEALEKRVERLEKRTMKRINTEILDAACRFVNATKELENDFGDNKWIGRSRHMSDIVDGYENLNLARMKAEAERFLSALEKDPHY